MSLNLNKKIQIGAWECTLDIKRWLTGCNYPKVIRMMISEKRQEENGTRFKRNLHEN